MTEHEKRLLLDLWPQLEEAPPPSPVAGAPGGPWVWKHLLPEFRERLRDEEDAVLVSLIASEEW